MTLKLSESTDFQLPEAGLVGAICTGVIDLGVQMTGFGEKAQILLTWELGELMGDGRPFTISRQFTASLHRQSALRPFLETWRGSPFTKEQLQGFDLQDMLGKACQILVQHQPSSDGSKTFANVASALPLAKDAKPIEPQNELIYFDMENPDMAAKAKLPEWIQKKIDGAIKPQKPLATAPKAEVVEPQDDDLAF
jgi:hypothetical protein